MGQLSMFDTVEDPTPAEDRGLTWDVLSPAAPLPQPVIDAVLRCGGNRSNSTLRICANYQGNLPVEENVRFLNREFDRGGRGIVVDGTPYAVWYGEDGLHIAAGREAQYQKRATIVTWAQMDTRIGELLKTGMYAPQADLDSAMANERAECAETLCYLESDTTDHFFRKELFAGIYPDKSDRVAAALADPEQLSAIVSGLNDLIEASAQGKDVLRFHFHRPKLLLERLTNLQRERLTFTEAPTFLPTTPKLFITEDEINGEMRRGGITQDGDYRTYSYALQGHSGKDLADYLKREYGTGGHSPALNASTGSEFHDSKGIKLKRGGCADVFLTWASIAQRVTALVRTGRYMSAEALEKIPDYEKGVLAGEVYHFYSRLPPEISRPFPAGFDYYDGIKVTRPLLDDPAAVADTVLGMERAMAQLAQEDGEHDYQQRVLRNLTAYRDGTFSLFTKGSQPAPPAHPKQVRPAPKAQPTMDTPPHEGAPLPKSILPPTTDGVNEPPVGGVTGPGEEKAAQGDDFSDIDVPALREWYGQYQNNPDSVDQTFVTQVIADATALGATPTTPPLTSAQNFRITDDDLGVGGPKAKFGANIAAIETLQRLERQKRNATPEEQDTLSRYVGWGGISEAFDERNEKWTKEYEQLKGLLSDVEYTAARASVLNAHYTSPTVIKAIYQCVGNMGFHMGNILEPAMGVGNFFGLLPEEMAGSKLYGAELDPITGRIAQKLYPLSRIEVKGFEKTAWPDSFFDVAVGNVPFGSYSVQDPKYDKLGFHIHDYFFAKTVDQVRPGGVVAFVTSRFTMDKKNSTVRKYLAQRCGLLGAIRLPNNAFKANAGTEVTADILFLQKRDHPIEVEPSWVQVGKTGDDLTVNQYFLDHPEMVLGELVREQRLYGSEDLVCKPFPDSDLGELLAGAIQTIHGSIAVLEQSTELEENETQGAIPADPDVRNFSYALVSDKLYFRDNSVMTPADTTKTGESRIRGMIGVRDAVRALIEAQMDGCDDDTLHQLQAKLNALYDRYTSKYGLLNSRGNDMAFSDDSSYPLLCALEILDEDGNLKAKADMFTKRTIRQESTVTHADTAVEALGISIGDRACVNLGFMSALMGHPGEVEPIIEALRGVIFRDPTAGDDPLAGWQAADEYLSGNVRLKLNIAKQWAEREPGRYDSNVEALTLAQPRDLEASEIGVRLGATWIPTEDYQRFVFDLMGTPMSSRRSIKVLYAGVNGLWNISGKYEDRGNKASVTYGTKRISGYEIIETSLNLKDVRIFDTVTENGSEKRVLNRKETILAQQKQHAIQQAFKDWVWSDPERRDRLAARYNEIFNDTRPREFDGSHIKFVGMNPEIKLRKHQADAVARVIYGGNALLAHVVGAGKTWTMAAAAMEGKRLGLCQKSLFVVPSHLTEQWGAEFLQLYPSANILVATKKDFEKANRKKFCGRIATGDYDAIIIGHSQFEKIPMSPERQEKQLNNQIREMENGIAQAKADRGERFTIKQMEYTRKNLEEKLKRLTSTTRKDDLITFEELGVDRLFVDEAHYYKNLFLYTKMRNVAGISQTEAQKSSDLYMKCLFMDERTAQRPGGPGRGVIFATGTPISNSMTELYTMMRYLQNDMLERKSLTFFDSWASTFGETVTALELAPEGTGYRLKTRFARFYNLPELMNLWKEVTDVQTADMLQLPVPKANYHTEVIKPTELQRETVKALGARAEEIRKGNVDPSVDNMLKITNDGRNLALDQRQMNRAFQDDPDSKVNDCVQNILTIWERTSEHHSAQMVFCDLSTPKHQVNDIRMADGIETVIAPPFSVYYDIKDKLVNRGVPEQEIAFIHDANTDARKAELFAKVRAGQVRVLLGSTAKMGAGTNAQKRLAALHHLDVPWRPSDIEQREGRILRQGNENEEVDIYRYVTEGTFDAYSWQLIETKQKFIGQIMTSKSPARSCEDIDTTALSYAEVKALAAGDPRVKERMDLDTEVARLTLLRANYQSEHYRLEDQLLKHFPSQITLTDSIIAACKADSAILAANSFPTLEDFTIVVDGKTYREKEKAGEALIIFAKTVEGSDAIPAGAYRGLRLEMFINPMSREYQMSLAGQWSYGTVLGGDAQGNITRLNNALERLPELIQQNQDYLDTLHKEVSDAKAELAKPWPQEEEWQEKSARLSALNLELNMDLQTPDTLDAVPDPDEVRAPRQRERER